MLPYRQYNVFWPRYGHDLDWIIYVLRVELLPVLSLYAFSSCIHDYLH